MHKLIMHMIGPIKHCELDCSHFITLVGFQASGKSTIAKTIYFFRTIKEDIDEIVTRRMIRNALHQNGADLSPTYTLKKELENRIRDKFLRTFGSSWGMSNEMFLEYHYTDTCYIKISLKEDRFYESPNYIWVDLCPDVSAFLKTTEKAIAVGKLYSEQEITEYKETLYTVFDDRCQVVYIPAGRSMMTVLSQQLSYIYATMEDTQKRALDSCTRDYIERILKIKPAFSEGIMGLHAQFPVLEKTKQSKLKAARDLIGKILRGSYRYNNGEEQIVLENGKYVKINFSSSGQQESVWILNLLYYYLLLGKSVLFIIEEPESHLFPESQKYITELISLVNNCGHPVVLTTHSPYVLGTLNNLLYVHTLPEKFNEEKDEIISRSLWLDYEQVNAWFVVENRIENCMDAELKMIQNERIDEISKVINNDFDRLMEIQFMEQGD